MSPAKCAATSKKFFPKRKHGPAAGKPFPQRTQKASQISAGLSNPTDWPAGIRRPFRSNGLARQGTPHRHPPAFPTQRTRPAGHPPQASAGHSAPTDSPGRAHPIGIRRPFRSNGLARQGTPHRHPPAFPPQRTRPVGQASQTSAGRSRRNQLKSVFSGDMRPGKNTSQPSSVRPPKGAVHAEGCNPQFWEGPRARQATRHPRVTGLPNEAQPFLAPPKIQNSAFPTVLGWGSTSRMLAMPVRYMTIRSNPRPKPACLQEPNRRRSRYHQ